MEAGIILTSQAKKDGAMLGIDWMKGSGLEKKTPTQASMEAAVLFSLWAQGHRRRTVFNSTIVILFGALVQFLIWIYYLPMYFIRFLPEIILSGTLTILLANFAEGGLTLNYIYLFSLTFILLIKDKALRSLRCILFDIGDFISLSFLSRKFIKKYLILGPITSHYDESGLREHLFTSRFITSGPFDAETSAFQDVASACADDWDTLEQLIEDYWREFPNNPNYWRDVRAQRRELQSDRVDSLRIRKAPATSDRSHGDLRASKTGTFRSGIFP